MAQSSPAPTEMSNDDPVQALHELTLQLADNTRMNHTVKNLQDSVMYSLTQKTNIKYDHHLPLKATKIHISMILLNNLKDSADL